MRRKEMKSPFDGQNLMVYAEDNKVYAPKKAKRVSTKKNDQEHVELFRFVTPYRTGMEAIMDMTAYAPLIKAAIAANNLTFYNFVDTWVSNHTEQDILYMNNVTGKCVLRNTSQGNGWGLTADLLFFKPEKQASTHPRELVTLSSGWYGGLFKIGRIAYHEANITEGGKAVMLEKPTDFSTVKKATVYDLKKEEAGIASLIGYVTE